MSHGAGLVGVVGVLVSRGHEALEGVPIESWW